MSDVSPPDSDESNDRPGELAPEQLPVEPLSALAGARIGVSFSHSGPLPAAREFAGYERILPGAADRILTMAEKQLDHRLELEKAVIVGGVTSERLGLLAGVAVVCTTLYATVLLARAGLGAWGVAAVIAEIAALVYAVRHVAEKNSEERKTNAAKHREIDDDNESP